MKKKIFSGLAVFAIATIAALNMGLGSKTNGFSDVMLVNVEALAGCEDDPYEDIGRGVVLKCKNSSGEEYNLNACDFNKRYDTICSGRPANTG